MNGSTETCSCNSEFKKKNNNVYSHWWFTSFLFQIGPYWVSGNRNCLRSTLTSLGTEYSLYRSLFVPSFPLGSEKDVYMAMQVNRIEFVMQNASCWGSSITRICASRARIKGWSWSSRSAHPKEMWEILFMCFKMTSKYKKQLIIEIWEISFKSTSLSCNSNVNAPKPP